jgi:hypothetical protein
MSASNLVRRETFFVGGEYIGPPRAPVMHGKIWWITCRAPAFARSFRGSPTTGCTATAT